MSTNNEKYKVMADVLEHKTGSGHYVKVKEAIPAGTILQVQDPRSLIDFFVERGFVDAEEGEKRKNKIPKFLSAQLVLRPTKKS